jgi:hypothetical protein
MLSMILGLVRHLMTFGGGYLVTSGVTSASDVEAGIGAVVTLIGIGASIYQKRTKAK